MQLRNKLRGMSFDQDCPAPMLESTPCKREDSAVQFIERMKSHLITGRSEHPSLKAFSQAYSNSKPDEFSTPSHKLKASDTFFSECTRKSQQLTQFMK
jgi:hypothetical protein